MMMLHAMLWLIAGCAGEEPEIDCFSRPPSQCVEPECFPMYGVTCGSELRDVYACADASDPCNTLGVACQPIGGGACVEWDAGCSYSEECEGFCPPGWEFCEGSGGVMCPSPL